MILDTKGKGKDDSSFFDISQTTENHFSQAQSIFKCAQPWSLTQAVGGFSNSVTAGDVI